MKNNMSFLVIQGVLLEMGKAEEVPASAFFRYSQRSLGTKNSSNNVMFSLFLIRSHCPSQSSPLGQTLQEL